MRRSHFEEISAYSLLSAIFFRSCKQQEMQFAVAKVVCTKKPLFVLCWEKAQLGFQQFYEYFFPTSSCQENSFCPSPTWFFSTALLFYSFFSCEAEGKSKKRRTRVNYFMKLNEKARINQVIILSMRLSFIINYDRLKCKFFLLS